MFPAPPRHTYGGPLPSLPACSPQQLPTRSLLAGTDATTRLAIGRDVVSCLRATRGADLSGSPRTRLA
ncbi:hypothetical protein E2C01_066573 [Portunus trituberculatus]|uniref:Uncharacterized protein n=1 Tax=Portunus trituberculatus TaxID=210409 RepID=A0A5B7HV18_PORTR|nr:hypothetical protein [Portunus trituberculatus]